MIVARHLLARDGVLHHLAVLPDDAEIAQARPHLSAAARHVRIVPVLLALARFALHADVVWVGAQPLTGIALGGGALALAGQEALALAEVLLVGSAAGAAPAVASTGGVALAAAAEVLAAAALLLHGAHLVERLLHGLEGPVRLAPLERLHAVGRIARPVTALAAQALHLLEQFAQLLGRDLIGPEPAGQRLRLAEDHLVLAL